MATGKKYFRIRECVDCGLREKVRKDSPSERCKSCGCKAREAASPRNKTTSWSGTRTWKNAHARLRRKSRSNICPICSARGTSWAFIGIEFGQLNDLSQYIPLCDSCHYRLDRMRVACI